MKYKRKEARTIIGKFYVIILLICLVMGFMIGVFQAVSADEAENKALISSLDLLTNNDDTRAETFVEGVIQNGGYMLLVWLTAFVPLGSLAAYVILFIRSMGYGFTLAALIRAFGWNAALFIITNLGVKCIIIIAATFFLCLTSIKRVEVIKSGKDSQMTAY
ncbi:MAG: hypothetical protein LBQ68_04930, partial [Clostridiales bacterium]|nr:hypothetical protein [Clostridiales bacterium]